MSVVPLDIPGVGPTSQRLVQNPGFDPMKAGFGTEEYFVWSRVDGSTTVKDLILMTGLPVDRAVAIVRRLSQAGAVTGPGGAPLAGAAAAQGTPAQGTPRPAAPGGRDTGRTTGSQPAAQQTGRTTGSQPAVPQTGRTTGPQPAAGAVKREPAAAPLPELDDPTAAEQAALAEEVELPEDDRRRILVGQRLAAAGEPWAILGVARDADKKVLKRAFFERSKLFHPDRYYGRDLGTFAARLHHVFEAITWAHAELTDGRTRAEREAATAPQTPSEYAAELFDRACVAELSGDLDQALKLFAAAVKLDGQARYLRRAATCALAARELRAAEDYAKKATQLEPSDPSTARLLARVLRELGKLDDAEEVLVMALALRIESDQLHSELAADLHAVRELLAR